LGGDFASVFGGVGAPYGTVYHPALSHLNIYSLFKFHLFPSSYLKNMQAEQLMLYKADDCSRTKLASLFGTDKLGKSGQLSPFI
jgi:hypothetical protein